jgi:small subunit ribosomal protein S6
MRKYEIMYIIRPSLEAEARKGLILELSQILLDRGAEELQVNEWGMRELAYEIADFKKGYYVVVQVKTTSEATTELDRVMRIKEDILRHIVISREEK